MQAIVKISAEEKFLQYYWNLKTILLTSELVVRRFPVTYTNLKLQTYPSISSKRDPSDLQNFPKQLLFGTPQDDFSGLFLSQIFLLYNNFHETNFLCGHFYMFLSPSCYLFFVLLEI